MRVAIPVAEVQAVLGLAHSPIRVTSDPKCRVIAPKPPIVLADQGGLQPILAN
jgi:hypothetical protein